MNNDVFFKSVLGKNMPDTESVFEMCTKHIDSDARIRKNYNYSFWFKLVASIIIVFSILLITPIGTHARRLLSHFIAIVTINDSKIEFDNDSHTVFTIPKECSKVELDGDIYNTKSYTSIDSLKHDTNIDMLSWNGCKSYSDILLAVKNNEYARLSIIYQIFDNGDIPDDIENGTVTDVMIHGYVPIKDSVTFKDIALKDDELKYSTIDDEGNVVKYSKNEEYESIEKYYSNSLSTDITVVSDKNILDSDEVTDYKQGYIFYFVYDGVLYQVNVVGDIDNAKSVIESLS